MRFKKLLVLGNSPQINDIEFDKLDPSIVTFGVNRIWLKHFPNYFYFHDSPLLKEIEGDRILKSKLISSSLCFSSDYLNLKPCPGWIDVHNRVNRGSYPDSVTTGLQILFNKYLDASEYTIYVAGTSLNWSDPSHFWKQIDYRCSHNPSKQWYVPRFELMFNNWKRLKDLGYNVISVTPGSRLNKLFRSEGIENLYRKD
jgi:hypothetical protein